MNTALIINPIPTTKGPLFRCASMIWFNVE